MSSIGTVFPAAAFPINILYVAFSQFRPCVSGYLKEDRWALKPLDDDSDEGSCVSPVHTAAPGGQWLEGSRFPVQM